MSVRTYGRLCLGPPYSRCARSAVCCSNPPYTKNEISCDIIA